MLREGREGGGLAAHRDTESRDLRQSAADQRRARIVAGALAVGKITTLNPGHLFWTGAFSGVIFDAAGGLLAKDMGAVVPNPDPALDSRSTMITDFLNMAWDGVSKLLTMGGQGVLVAGRAGERVREDGGDPARVALFGQSSGGTLIFGIMAAPAAQGRHSSIPGTGAKNPSGHCAQWPHTSSE